MKWRLIKIVCYAVLFAASVYAQNISHDLVKKGIDAFYMADFEEAQRILQNAIINEFLSDDELFYAYLYVGFCHIRQESDAETVHLYFQRAAMTKPNMALDPMKIPPDLYDAFTAVGRAVLGNIVVLTEPLDASVILIEPSANQIGRKTTPAIFHNLLEGSYQVLVSKDGYDAWSKRIKLHAGATDTLNVVLVEKGEKSFFAKFWPYGAGALAATAIILVATNRGDDEPPASKPDLPYPPPRP